MLNDLVSSDSDTAQTIYRAFKAARLKCEQIGSSTTASSSKDYVDIKNFLQMLTSELSSAGILEENTELSEAIKAAIIAADEATYANVFNYAGQKIYYNHQDGDETWYNKDLWNSIHIVFSLFKTSGNIPQMKIIH